MNGAFDIGAVALRAQQRALDTIANNVANVNTTTFKRVDSTFSEIIAEKAQPISRTEVLASRDYLQSGGVRFTSREAVLDQGELRPTGNRLDVAIDGLGFIELMGPDGQSFLWRGGALKVLENGLLGVEAGYALRAGISVPDDAVELKIATDGVVKVETADGDLVEIGQISLVRAASATDLERMNSGFYRPTEYARLIEAQPGEDGAGLISQGYAENSNVQLADEMVQLLTVQRAFASSAQIIQAADQLAGIANSLRR